MERVAASTAGKMLGLSAMYLFIILAASAVVERDAIVDLLRIV